MKEQHIIVETRREYDERTNRSSLRGLVIFLLGSLLAGVIFTAYSNQDKPIFLTISMIFISILLIGIFWVYLKW